jgi:hypothetical protein
MSATKRPSTSSLRRYLTSRPYISVADIRRRFGLEADAISHIARNGTSAYIGLPEREASKLQDLWQRDEVGVELSVEVRAPVVVGIYPMRIARFVLDQATNGNGYHPQSAGSVLPEPTSAVELRSEPMDEGQPVPSELVPPPVTLEDAPEA